MKAAAVEGAMPQGGRRGKQNAVSNEDVRHMTDFIDGLDKEQGGGLSLPAQLVVSMHHAMARRRGRTSHRCVEGFPQKVASGITRRTTPTARPRGFSKHEDFTRGWGGVGAL
jgi:hypothetical protein